MTERTCAECDTEVEGPAKFCRACGAGLETVEDGQTWPSDVVESGRLLAAVSHLLALLTWVFGPLIVMLVSDNPFVVQNAKNAVMWQLMLFVYTIISTILVLVGIGIVLLFALWLLNLVFIVIATVKASEGDAWQYPLTPSV